MIDNLKSIAQSKVDNSQLTKLPEVSANESNVANIMTVVFGVAGAIAVFIIVIAGFNFITGGDNPEKISRAKNTIIYALIGLAIVILAEAIVLTVLGAVLMKAVIMSLVSALTLVAMLSPSITNAADPFEDVCKGQAKNSSVCKDKEVGGANPLWGKDGIITNLINLVSIIAGIAAVIIIIVAGLRFVTGGNNPQEVQKARNMIIYASVGLVIVAFAQVIVRFFLSQL